MCELPRAGAITGSSTLAIRSRAYREVLAFRLYPTFAFVFKTCNTAVGIALLFLFKLDIYDIAGRAERNKHNHIAMTAECISLRRKGTYFQTLDDREWLSFS